MRRRTITAEQFIEAQDRSNRVKSMMERDGIRVVELAYHMSRSEQCIYRWFRDGLTSNQYEQMKKAVARILANRT